MNVILGLNCESSNKFKSIAKSEIPALEIETSTSNNLPKNYPQTKGPSIVSQKFDPIRKMS